MENIVPEAHLSYATITELGQAILSGALKAVAIAEYLLDRIEHLNTKLHAFITLTRERAQTEAKEAEAATRNEQSLGPLHGIPYAVKDVFDVEGQPTTADTELPSDNAAVGKTHLVQVASDIISSSMRCVDRAR